MSFIPNALAGLKGHAQAYAELLAAELEDAVAQRISQVLWGVLVASSGLVALLLGGVALMIWGAMPASAPGSAQASIAPWLVWATPLPALLVFLGASARLWLHKPAPAFATLREHIDADLRLILPKDAL